MSEFVRVANVTEIPDPGRLVVEIEERFIVVFHAAGQFYAIDDVCTHDDGPLGEGELFGFEIACPRHGARFDIRNGKVTRMPATRPTRSHEVRVEGEAVLVKIND